MAKIAVFKVELATGDRASHAIIKATIQATIRSLGVADVAPAPEADPGLLDDDRTAWYSSAQVKQWVNPAKPKAS